MEAFHPETNEGLVRGCACRGEAGFAHVSCLARQAKVLVEEAEERDLDDDAFQARWRRWDTCRLCEQDYHGVVRCALGWACWKAYVGRPDADQVRLDAMTMLGNGLHEAGDYEDALSVQEADLATRQRLGDSEDRESLLVVQGNLACTYYAVGRLEEALSLERDVYSERLKLFGEDYSLGVGSNYANSLVNLECFEEAKSLLRRMIPVARRVLGENHEDTLRLRANYARALSMDDASTLDNLREAVTTFEDTERIARRVLGGAHPLTMGIGRDLQKSQAALRARETPPGSA